MVTFLAVFLMVYTFPNLLGSYRYHKLRKKNYKFYRRHYELISKFNVGLKTLLREGLSEPEFYGYLVHKFKKRIGRPLNDFSIQLRNHIVPYKRIGYNLNVIRFLTQSWFITMLPSLIARQWFGHQNLSWPRLKANHFSWLWPELLVCCLAHRG